MPDAEDNAVHATGDALRTVSPTPWLTAERAFWLASVTVWLAEVAESHGLGGLVDVTPIRERPWGATARVTTSSRVLYFKAEGRGGTHEPRILVDLGERWPGLVPEVVAADYGRGWILMADHGVPMTERLDAAAQIGVFERFLPVYAEMQEALAASAEHWIEIGAPDRGADRLPVLLDRLLAGELGGGPLPIDPALRRQLDRALPTFSRVCEELACASPAKTLDHGDLHANNVLVDGDRQRLIDWGDSCVTHPFSSLFVTYHLVVTNLDPAERPAAIRRLRDAYLEPWGDLGSGPAGQGTFARAIWVAHISRALDYLHMVQNADDLVAEWHKEVVDLLRSWEAKRPLLGRGDDLILTVP